MEPSFLKDIPKFKTPEEELQYLRAHVAQREQELIGQGNFEHAEEQAMKHVIGEYGKLPVEEVVHKDNLIKKEDAEGIVLKLKPETHDTIMEELLGIVITKGVRNA